MSFDQWLRGGESQTGEFKSSFDKTTVESLVAFANAQGGTVLVGVSDVGLINGVTLGEETLNEWGMHNSHSDSFASSPACGRGLRRGHIRFVAKNAPGNGWLATLPTNGRTNQRSHCSSAGAWLLL